ncbi:uncharacterized protein CIMG_12142 [Coccidioides immitis RS]|uniref:Uncharacterized protein n=4 Tax=Coccidioides immitis TaxID=5501 RepID=A0A0D8JUJ3_COCIM|nr:uncharacterized protein CIMG_12142 [Coccidioides immitis RS]KJF60794.1 hypothetical protein CIMG_12142 [Coccidioides immitis RS]KMP06671.1 hypothetical protein CIRG_06351 [Coccidioides immitis RMSCC 2394]KMU73642.1 hypothetical protein CISG_03693 [Coccidioides immitis RMSCC 3703]KMU84249.1 hypothetical protein CIHG_02035 [Coccidioides immitis H538.4]
MGNAVRRYNWSNCDRGVFVGSCARNLQGRSLYLLGKSFWWLKGTLFAWNFANFISLGITPLFSSQPKEA